MVHGLKDDHEFGFWHIGQAYTKVKNFSDIAAPTDDMAMLQGQLLQINFAPVWRGRTTGEFVEHCRDLLDTDRDDAAIARWVGKYQGLNLLTSMWHDLLYMSLLAPPDKRERVGVVIDELVTFRNVGLVFRLVPAAQNALALGASAQLLASGSMMQSGAAPEDPAGVQQPAKRFKKAAQVSSAQVSSAQVTTAPVTTAQVTTAQAAEPGAAPAAPPDTAEAASDWDFEKELQELVASDAAQKTGQQKPKSKAKA
jgi:hypothetical protein